MNLRFQACVVSSLVVAVATVGLPSRAHDLAPHPAVRVLVAPSSINPNTFIVGHPASPTWGRAAPVHANGEHPAVLVARRSNVPHIDVNTFIVQPPATTAWTIAPEQDDTPLRMALKTAPRR